MKTVKKKLADLKRPERNVRMHTDKQIKEFQRSLEMFGQIRPIVIDENNVMLAGNGLYETMLAMDYKEADCYVVTGLSENEKKKLMLADNRIYDLGVNDLSAFDALIAELGDDLDVPGYEDDLLKTLSADAEEIDEMMSSYGLVDDEKKSEIIQAKETYAKQEQEFVQKAQEFTPKQQPEAKPSIEDDNNEQSGDNEERQLRFLVCPKCGERIWL